VNLLSTTASFCFSDSYWNPGCNLHEMQIVAVYLAYYFEVYWNYYWLSIMHQKLVFSLLNCYFGYFFIVIYVTIIVLCYEVRLRSFFHPAVHCVQLQADHWLHWRAVWSLSSGGAESEEVSAHLSWHSHPRMPLLSCTDWPLVSSTAIACNLIQLRHEYCSIP